MARQNISVGTNANDATGDTLRVAFGKVNNNFIELYASGGTQGTTGAQGIQGTSGSAGSQGAQGLQGVQGVSIQGAQGVNGLSVQGVQGTTGPVAGADTQVIFNDNGSPAGSANFLFNKTSNTVTANIFSPKENVSWSTSNTILWSVSNGNVEGYSVLRIIPDTVSFATDQYIIIDPGVSPNHVHLRAGGSMDESSALLTLGGDASYFRLDSGPNPEAYVASNNKIWTFNQSGGLGFPDSTTQTTAWTGIPGPYADDTEAATNLVAIGNPYYKAGGQVYVRLA